MNYTYHNSKFEASGVGTCYDDLQPHLITTWNRACIYAIYAYIY